MAVAISNGKKTVEELYIGPRIPQGLTAAIEGLTKEIIRHRPEDIYIFAANHFEKLLKIRKQYDSNKKMSHFNDILLTKTKDTEKQISKILCGCKKKLRSQDVASLKSSGWSLNETAKVLKRHRSIFGEDGKKISLDEIYDLANVKSPTKLSLKHYNSKDYTQKSKSSKKASREVDKNDLLKNQSKETNKRDKTDKTKKTTSQKQRISKQGTHSGHTKIIQNDKIESIDSSNLQEINNSSQTSKLNIEESGSSSNTKKIYETFHETSSFKEEKMKKLKQFSGRLSKSDISNVRESENKLNISSKLSKSTTCLVSPDLSNTMTDAFESKLKETQNLLEKISSNFNYTIRRSMSAKDLHRVGQSGDLCDTKISETSSASKLRQFSLPTVRPLSGSKNDFRKNSLNDADNCLTLPLISQKPNKNTKQIENQLTLPILSPHNNGSSSFIKSSTEENGQFKSETQDQYSNTIKDICKQEVNILEKKQNNLRAHSADSKFLLNKSQQGMESFNIENDNGNIKRRKSLIFVKSKDLISENKNENIKSASTTNGIAQTKSSHIENKELVTDDVKSVSEDQHTTCSSNIEIEKVESLSTIEDKEMNLKKNNESVKYSPSDNEKLSNDEIKPTKMASNEFNWNTKTTDKEYYETSTEELNDETPKSKFSELDKTVQIPKYRCPSHDCNKGINNELLRLKLEELVKVEESILQDVDEADLKSKEQENQLKVKDTEDETERKQVNHEESTFGRLSVKSSSRQNLEEQFSSVSQKEKRHSDDESLTNQSAAESLCSYILTEGSPCEIPDSVTTVIFPDRSPYFSDDFEIRIEEVNDDVLTTAFGETIQYEAIDYDSVVSTDLIRGLKNIHDISIVRQDLQRIKEEEEDEEEQEKQEVEENDDVSANEDSTIVLEKILENEELETTQSTKDEKESGMTLQEFLLHCTLNESTEETSINDTVGDAVISLVPELNLQVIEDATDSMSKTKRQMSDAERSIDEIENSVLLSECTSTSIHELQGQTYESLSGDQQQTDSDELSIQLDTNLMNSSKSTASLSSSNERLIRAVVLIQKCYRKYKSDKQKITTHHETSSSISSRRIEKCTEKRDRPKVEETKIVIEKNHRHKVENTSANTEPSRELYDQKKEFFEGSSSLDEMTLAIIKIQRCYRKYKSRKNSETNTNQEQTMPSTSKTSVAKCLKHEEESSKKNSTVSLSSLNEMISAAVTIQKCYRKYRSKKRDTTSTVQNENTSLILSKQEKTSLDVKKSDSRLSKECAVPHLNEKDQEQIEHDVKLQNTMLKSTDETIHNESKSKLSTMNGKNIVKSKASVFSVEKDNCSMEFITSQFTNDKDLKSVSVDQILISVIKIQKCYRKYRLRKLQRIKDEKKGTIFASTYLQHTGEFHDCIPLSVLDSISKHTKDKKRAEKLSKSGSSGDQKKARREWNQNPPLSPSTLYNAECGKVIDTKEGTSKENVNILLNDRFPGVMIYADSLKNNFKQSIPQSPIENEKHKFMNFVLLAGEEPVLQKSYVNFLTMQNLQSSVTESNQIDTERIKERLEFIQPQHSSVIIEEISNDDNQSFSYH